MFNAYTDQTLNQSIYLSTYLSIYLYCVKSMFFQNTFSFDFTLRFSPRINFFISLLACFWMMQPRHTLRKSSAKAERRKHFYFRKSVNLMRWCHVWWSQSWRESSFSFQAARLPVCCRSEVRPEYWSEADESSRSSSIRHSWLCSWLCRHPVALFAAKLLTFSSWVK